MLSYRFHSSLTFKSVPADHPMMSVNVVRECILRAENITLRPREAYLELREASSGRVLDDDQELIRVVMTPLVARRRAALDPAQNTIDIAEAQRAPQRVGRPTR